jgi:hypothetical protein
LRCIAKSKGYKASQQQQQQHPAAAAAVASSKQQARPSLAAAAAATFAFHFICKCTRGHKGNRGTFVLIFTFASFASPFAFCCCCARLARLLLAAFAFAFCLLGFTPCSHKQRLHSQKQR